MQIKADLKIQRGDFQLSAKFSVPAKGITAIFGPSGCGKTTLLRILAGLEDNASGTLSIGDNHWQTEQSSLPTWQRPIGYVFQEASLFPHLSVIENLKYPLKRINNRQRQKSNKPQLELSKIIQLTGIEHLIDRLPASLSGGERQRVAIARALLTQPELLLMDEPLSALDLKSKSELLPFLEQLHQQLDIPVFYVSHSPEEVARLADQLILMESGKVTAVGPLAEMLARNDTLIAQREDAFSVLQCKVISHQPAHHLTELEFGQQRLRIPMIDAAAGSNVRLRVQARDISINLDCPQLSSILNILPATITDISNGQLEQSLPGQRLVQLQVGDALINAKISDYSCSRLALTPGMQVFAQIKAMALCG
ncbi:molybdenum ABC transporter ATP-binding protein [Pelagibaculum spongiae]|uniref:Molybdenum ABC transporter ATP-binding protein n=1 Tax=Pelagibaculum spongiae TaxID=2080658 RepID=A0A2V1GN65_9GAMM|nr:molybdenum ABC transporter ATP-binding protein [Pelagibaculum spongiae]PVZ63458.1 molybdenum ABC transporter ATP-binding protein [Pelagibaculum spongiae]